MSLVAKTYPLFERTIEEGLRSIFMNEDLRIAESYRSRPTTVSYDPAYEGLLERSVNRIMLEIDANFEFTENKEK